MLGFVFYMTADTFAQLRAREGDPLNTVRVRHCGGPPVRHGDYAWVIHVQPHAAIVIGRMIVDEIEPHETDAGSSLQILRRGDAQVSCWCGTPMRFGRVIPARLARRIKIQPGTAESVGSVDIVVGNAPGELRALTDHSARLLATWVDRDDISRED